MIPPDHRSSSESNQSRILLWVFGLAGLILASSLGFTYWVGYRAIQQQTRLVAKEAGIDTLDSLLSSIKDAETGERGYLLTGRDDFLAPYQNALNQLHEQLVELRALGLKGELPSEQVSRAEGLITAKLRDLSELIELRRNDGLQAAVRSVETGEGKDVMDQIRALIGEMRRQELAERDRTAEEVRAALTARNIVFTLVTLLNAGFLILTYRPVNRAFRERERAHEALRRQAALIELEATGSRATVAEGLIPIISVASAAGIRYMLEPWLGPNIPFGLFFLAVAVSALYAGFRAALIATVFATLLSDFLFLAPSGSLMVATYREASTLLLFVVTSLAISLIGLKLQRGRRKLEASVQVLRRQASLIDLSPDAVIVRLDDGTIKFWSKGAEKLYGWKREEAIGRRTHQLLQTRFPEPLEKITSELNAGRNWSGELVQRAKDGREIIVQSYWHLNLQDTDRELLETNIDLTARKLAERALASVAQFPAENPQPVLRLSTEAEVLFANKPAEELMQREGWKRGEPAPENFRAPLQTSPGPDQSRCAFELTCADQRRFAFVCVAVRDKGYVNLYGRDITEERMAIQALRESEERLKLATAATGYGTFDYYPLTGKLIWSPEARRHFGLGPDAEVDYEVFLRGLHPEDRERVQRVVNEALQPDSGGSYTVEYRTIGIEDRKERWLSAVGQAFFDQNGRAVRFIGATVDITARKEAEEALRESERRVRRKLESVISPEGDLSVLDLKDLLDVPALQEMMENFYAVSHMPIGIIDMQGQVLVGCGWQEICTRYHRSHPDTCLACTESDITLTVGQSPGESRLYKCKNNMWDMATPIFVAGKHLGNIFTGQFFFDDEQIDREAFRAQAHRFGFDENEYLAALDSVPRLSRQTVNDGMSFFAKLAGMLSQLGYSNAKLARLLAERDRLTHSLQESEARFRISQELSPDGFTILSPARDASGQICDFVWVYENAAIARLNGTDPKEVVGRRVSDVLPGHASTPFHKVYREVAETGNTQILEAPFLRQGATAPTWYRIAAVSMGTDIAVLAQDITDRKRLEDDLRAALTSAERAKAAAERANRAKDHFLATLSHELRTPLTPVLAAVSLMQRTENLPGEVYDGLQMISRNVSLEARLIDDLLDLTKIARGKIILDKRALNICEVLSRAAEVCMPDIEARRIHFGMQLKGTPLPVHADGSRLQQVFWNLINNSVKFTPDGGCIGVQGYARNGDVVVEVIDSGIGIEPDALAKIFDAFEQTDQQITRRFGGLGLGLAITKRLVELHGGQIFAESKGKGEGATFRVILPRHRHTADVDVAAQQAAPTDRAASKRILLVEDHGDTAMMIKRLLESSGYEVITAGDVTQALEAANLSNFDILISDLGLPDRSGLELIAELRRNGSRIGAIALSGYGREEDIVRSKDAGFTEHLTKPVNFDMLASVLERVSGSL